MWGGVFFSQIEAESNNHFLKFFECGAESGATRLKAAFFRPPHNSKLQKISPQVLAPVFAPVFFEAKPPHHFFDTMWCGLEKDETLENVVFSRVSWRPL